MKYIVLVPDGMADLPLEELNGKTPMETAAIPNMDRLAAASELGMTCNVPEGMPPGSAVANLSIMGYDPKVYYTGRGPLEAASLDIELGDNVAYRCNLVTVSDGKMEDFTSGHISSEEAWEIIDTLNETLANEEISFHRGKSYRHIMLAGPGRLEVECTPPHDITGQSVAPHLPKGDCSVWVNDLMERSKVILAEHPVNTSRMCKGKRTATQIWLWGQGTQPSFSPFKEAYGLSGAMITAVDLLQGMAKLIGWDVIEVPGATGFVDTNYEGKAEYALRALESVDMVYVHVEAPDEAGHMGDLALKIKALEDFDSRFLGTLLKGLTEPHRIMILPDHPTPVSVKTHTREKVPFMIYDSTRTEPKGKPVFTEKSAEATGIDIPHGHEMMRRLIAAV